MSLDRDFTDDPSKDEPFSGFSQWIGAAETGFDSEKLNRELKELDEMTGESAVKNIHKLKGKFSALTSDFLSRVNRVANGETVAWIDEDLQKIEEALKIWSLVNKKAESAEQKLDPNYHPEEVWIVFADQIHPRIRALLNPSEADISQLGRKKESAIERADLVNSLFASEKFKAKGELLEYLTCELWLSVENNRIMEFDLGLEITPLIKSGLVACAREGSKESIEQSLNQLLACGSSEIAAMVFEETSLSYDEKERYAVNYINTFGYLSFIEVLAPLTQEDNNKKLFEEFSGQQVVVVMEKLDKVYDEALDNFKEHYDKKVTKGEVDLVKEILERVVGKKLSEARILEVAAGFGRLAKSILENGCGHLTAIEPHGKMFEILAKNAETHPNFKPVRGVWEKLKEYGLGILDLGVCLGRSVPHANSPEKALVAFGQMIGVSKNWLVDEPDPEIGYYAEFSTNLEKTMRDKGVNPDKAKLIYDSPDGKHFFHRMILGKKQLEQIGQMLGFKIVEVKTELIPGEMEVKNVYYLIETDQDFDLLELIETGRLVDIVKELGMDKRGIDYDMVPERWGMSLGQALVCAKYGERALELAALVEIENKKYGIPKMINSYDRQGGVYLKFRQKELNNPIFASEWGVKL